MQLMRSSCFYSNRKKQTLTLTLIIQIYIYNQQLPSTDKKKPKWQQKTTTTNPCTEKKPATRTKKFLIEKSCKKIVIKTLTDR